MTWPRRLLDQLSVILKHTRFSDYQNAYVDIDVDIGVDILNCQHSTSFQTTQVLARPFPSSWPMFTLTNSTHTNPR